MKHQILIAAALTALVVSYAGAQTQDKIRAEDSDRVVSEELRDNTVRRDNNTVPDSTVKPDNTGINVRDRNSANLTASDQGSSKTEREMAAAIRREITKNSELSTYAHNVKIIVDDGAITLRGPVRSTQEAQVVEQTAKRLSGNYRVQSDLQVTPKN